MTSPETLKPDELVKQLRSDAAQLARLVENTKFGSDMAVQVKAPDLLIDSLAGAADRILALQSDLERVTAERDAARDYAATSTTSKLEAANSVLLGQLATAEAALVKARTALEPFAAAVDNTDGNDDYSAASIWEHPCAVDLTIGDLRRARLALSAGGEDNGR